MQQPSMLVSQGSMTKFIVCKSHFMIWGHYNYFLGIEVARFKKGISLSQ